MPSNPSGQFGIPLTHQQMLMWSGQQLDPLSPIYNMGFWIEIPTALDEEIFCNAFQSVVDHSATHRSIIRTRLGEPILQVVPEIKFELPVLDFSNRVDSDVESMRWCERQCRKMFALEKQLFDSALVKLANDRYVWYINHHHLISDAWSSTQLFRIQSQAYLQMVSGKTPAFNFEEISKARPVAKADSDSTSRRQSIPFYGSRESRVLSASRREAAFKDGDATKTILQSVVEHENARSFSAELGSFTVHLTFLFALLYRVSGDRELCVGVPFHNRLTKAEKQSLGLFIDLHPITVSVDAQDSFKSLHEKVRVATHEYLKTATSPQRQKTANHKYNVIFNFINASFGDFAGVAVKPLWLHPGCHDREHHLRMHVEGFGGQPEIKFDFNESVFYERRRNDFINHLGILIRNVSNDWDRPIQQIDLVDAGAVKSDIPSIGHHAVSSELIVDRFQQVVAQAGEETAVRCGQTVLQFDEFDIQVEQLAGRLQQRITGTQNRVAICLNRSHSAVAAMLAVMKSGHVFVPVDPAWPRQRIQHIVNDCQASCIVTNSGVSLPETLEPKRLNVDRANPSTEPDRVATKVLVNPNDAAYILYTSGSTGKPKGVEITHGSIAHYINWASGYYGEDRPLSFPLFTPLTFDLTLTSIFVPLVTGGTLVVYEERPGGQDTALLQVLEDNLVDIIKLTPSHLSLLTGQNFSSSRVGQLILGGEDLSSDLARRTFNIFPPNLKIHNEYGPTESTVGCIVHTINHASEIGGASVPIGLPISGTSARIVNDALRLQPAGVAGELCVSGNGLATGYVNRPELTREKFVLLDSGDLVYRTGDIARVNDSGHFEYLGRIDEQVKIRGARIELKSIEAALREHPAIDEAVVTTFLPRSLETTVTNCSRCGIASNYPGIGLDENNVCDQCIAFESYRNEAAGYFRDVDSLKQVLSSRTDSTAAYDCVALLSGGKDSSYMLARLVDLDLRVLAFTLDNGYISEEAKANIRRVTKTLGVDHVFGSTPHMNKIFVDSLKRFSNVCQGCFKTIYTLAINLALENGIPFIVTGLSRGQLFETRLTRELFEEPCDSLVQIDESVLEARKAYHKVPDAVFKHLDVSQLQNDDTFEKVEFVDFYRYCDVTLAEMLEYLNQKLPWIRPGDTGRSTNCLINDVGIYVHKRNEGFHNYTMPYSWDVRMGHKTRHEAVDELVDRIDVEGVTRILDEIGYDGELAHEDRSARLVAYVKSEKQIERDEIVQFLKSRLPDFMLPSKFLPIDHVPLSANGKVDTSLLPNPYSVEVKRKLYFAPKTALEQQLVEIWQQVLGIEKIGIQDNFFDLGGDSILAIQIVALANQNGIRIKPADMFDSLTVEKLAGCAENSALDQTYDQNQQQVLPTTAQAWMFEHQVKDDDFWTQSVELELPRRLVDSDIVRLETALTKIVNGNPALRTRWLNSDSRFETQPAVDRVRFDRINIDEPSELDSPELRQMIERQLCDDLSFRSEKLVSGCVFRDASQKFYLMLMANHLAVDAVSWHRIIAELNQMISRSAPSELLSENVPTVAAWTEVLSQKVDSIFGDQIPYWQDVMCAPSPLGTIETDKVRYQGGYGLVRRRLEKTKTSAIENVVKKSRMTLHELLLSAFAQTMASWSKRNHFKIFVEGHGRDSLEPGMDFSRTIGWFTSIYPIGFEFSDAGPTSVTQIKEQIRLVPEAGLGYGALRYLCKESTIRDSLVATNNEVIFNFLGRRIVNEVDAIAVSRPLKLHRGPKVQRRFGLEFNLSLDDQLHVEAEFADDLFSMRQAEDLVTRFFAIVEQLGNESAASLPATKSDFPLANLNDRQLGDLAAALKRSSKKG